MKQQNVKQQNEAQEAAIRRTAEHWRRHLLPAALVEVAGAQGVDCSTSILLHLEIDFPGMPRLFGTLLTGKEKFINFEIETDASDTSVEQVEVWRDVTQERNQSFHNRGIGIGDGALAIRILRELNKLPGAN